MIGSSNIFQKILKEYISYKAEEIQKCIMEYENEIIKRTPIQEIKMEEYNVYLNKAIEYIEKTIRICSWVKQLRIKVLEKKTLLDKQLKLKQIAEAKRIEHSDIIIGISNKSEKEKMKKFLLGENILEKEYDLLNVKIELETIEAFKEEAEDIKNMVYAYYQAIKYMQREL